ncbi:alpha/beta fold hydrolase [Demequina lignilytica]|uniref:Alpha/beta hydrolase n=1 Tax=Demequina lignilytica TaxID=3051663 RepID=A0AB35MK46_9MICO|nr:alpha/beta hydrolase [Demequina sp. SYSU T0a273]MDN4484015.1 alpha/beta hydrolase [Demequina sp. SYSU T0a273]
MREGDLLRPDGCRVHWYDGGPEDAELVLFWHHGTPNIGQPPGPLMAPVTERGWRWISLDRPGYGGSDRREGRCVADVVDDVADVAAALAVPRFAVVGHSGGGPHALACAAVLGPERVRAAVSIAGLAPFGAPGLDWFGGMAPGGRSELEAAALGPAALAAQLESEEWDPESFTPGDHAALEGEWGWFGSVVEAALSLGPDGMIDDDVAYVSDWGCAVEDAGSVPVLVAHGEDDRVVPAAHGRWLADAIPGAEARFLEDSGHISVLLDAGALLDWLETHA